MFQDESMEEDQSKNKEKGVQKKKKKKTWWCKVKANSKLSIKEQLGKARTRIVC